MLTVQMADQRYIQMLQNTLAQEGGALIGGAYSGGCAPRKPRISPWDRMTDAQYDAAIQKSKDTKARRKKERERASAALSGQGFGYRGGAGAEDRANYLAGIRNTVDADWKVWNRDYENLFMDINVPIIPLGQRDKKCIQKALRDFRVEEEPEYVTKKMLRLRQGQV